MHAAGRRRVTLAAHAQAAGSLSDSLSLSCLHSIIYASRSLCRVFTLISLHCILLITSLAF